MAPDGGVRRLFRWMEPVRPPVAGAVPSHSAYDRLARWYDWSGALAFTDSCVDLTLELLNREGATQPEACLDVACGTGSFLLEMRRQGIRPFGVDRSHAMLVEARAKAREQDATLHLVCADMRSFALGRRFPLVTCFYDAINHLATAEGAAAAIETAAAHVATGGLLVFDTNNEQMFERVWSGPPELIEVGNGEVAIHYSYDRRQRTGAARVVFHRHGEAPVEGWVIERCHPSVEIEGALARSGVIVERRGAHPYFDDSDGSLKDLWVCRKR